MGRTNIPIDDELHERLSELKGDDETWNEFAERVADTLEDDTDEDGATQTACIPTEQAEEIARMAADKVENRMTRR